MKAFALVAASGLALAASPLLAQDEEGGEEHIVVTAQRIGNSLSAPISIGSIRVRPVIGIKRQADSAVRNIEIVSDSREEAMRKREVQAMLLDAIDRAKREGFSLVTGQFELTEITRANWQDQFPGLAVKADADQDEDADDADDDDEDDENEQAKPAFEDDGSSARVRLKVKTKLDGSIGNAQQRIGRFVKGVPATGRSEIEQTGGLALTIVKPEQYRDEIYRRIAEGAKHALGFYGPDYNLEVTGLSNEIAWEQVGNTEVFVYIPYSFTIGK